MTREGGGGSGARGRRRGPPRSQGRSRPAERARLARARAARKEEKRLEAKAKREVEADEQARRRAAWERPRHPVEPPSYPDGEEGPFRAGWVAILGRPNVGKSTLLNALLGQKLAATTHKPQTTRKNLLGVLNPPGAQMLLLDTPGHHQAKGPLNRYMVAQAEEAVREADVILFVLEGRGDGRFTPGNERLVQVVTKANKPVVVALNKVDSVADKDRLLPQIEELTRRLEGRLAGLVPISARQKSGLDRLVREVALALPASEPLLSDDEVTDQRERDIVAEFIREKATLELQEELPYSLAVTIERFEDLRPKLARIFATLHVERASQKGIVIGKQGARLKSIGARARKDIEFLLGVKVYLDLSVRVTGDWSQDARRLREFGYSRTPVKERADPSLAEELADALADLPPDLFERDLEDERDDKEDSEP